MKTLKSIFLTVFSLILFSFSSSDFEQQNNTTTIQILLETEFEKGFAEGYCEGWKDVRGNVNCPNAPNAPNPINGQSEDSWKDGYNTGFKRGMKDARG